MSKQMSSRFILAVIVMLCIAPAAVADDDRAPSAFYVVERIVDSVGEWFAERFGSADRFEDDGGDGDGVPNYNPNIDPIN